MENLKDIDFNECENEMLKTAMQGTAEECQKMNEIPRVEIKDKLNLTIEEAAAYSNIGINRIERMARRPNCPFVLYIGRKKLIKRKEFERYLEKAVEL